MLDPVVTDRTDVVAVTPERLWEVLADVRGYPTFWPWLADFDGRELTVGATWRGVITTGTPLRLAVTVALEEVVPGHRVSARIGGDLSGVASIDLAPHATGTSLRLAAALLPERSDLRALTRWVRPVSQASHDRVIARALAQLSAHLAP